MSAGRDIRQNHCQPRLATPRLSHLQQLLQPPWPGFWPALFAVASKSLMVLVECSAAPLGPPHLLELPPSPGNDPRLKSRPLTIAPLPVPRRATQGSPAPSPISAADRYSPLLVEIKRSVAPPHAFTGFQRSRRSQRQQVAARDRAGRNMTGAHVQKVCEKGLESTTNEQRQ